MDIGKTTFPASASEVLAARHGLCYAKAHLLCALLRANQIPCALAYQRVESTDGPCLHGLVAVSVNETWIYLDPRGGQNAPPVPERFGENHLVFDGPLIDELYDQPHPAVQEFYRSGPTFENLRLPN